VVELLPPIVRGREYELSVLEEQIDAVRLGAGTVTLIEGAAGIGKSRLLEEARRIAIRSSFRVGAARAEPGDSVVELAPLLDALSADHEPLLKPPILTRPVSAEQRYWLLQDIQARLERAAIEGPLLLCLDDLHWAGNGTAAALGSLPTRLAGLPIGWLLAYRPDSAPRLIGSTERLLEEGATKLILAPLSDSAVAEVTADTMRAQPDDALLAMARRSRGSPYLLAELLAGLREEQLVRVDSGQAELLESRLPHRVSDTMRQRLNRLSEPARHAAHVASSLGVDFSATDLAAMLGVTPSQLVGPVEELLGANLLIEREGSLTFTHELTREAVRGSLPQPVRRAIDRQAADVLLAAGALPVEVAIQLAESAPPGDDVAISTLLQAAEALATTDPGAGADLGQRALDLAPRTHPLRGPLVAQTATALHAAGRIDEARAFADNAVRQVLPPEQEAQVRLGIAGMWAVPPEVRADTGREALKLNGLPDGLRLAHMARLGYNLLVGGHLEEAQALMSQTAAMSTPRPDPVVQFLYALSRGGVEYITGHLAESLATFEGLLRAGFADGRELDELLTRLWRANALAALDRTDEALQAVDEMVADSLRRRLAFFLNVAEIWRGQLLLQMGRLYDAAVTMQDRFVPEGTPVVTVLDANGVVALGRVAIHTGDGRQLRQMVEIATAMLDERTPGVRRQAAWLLSLQAAAEGDPRRAHRWLCVLGRVERKSLLPRLWLDAGDEPHMVRMALAVGDRDLAQSAAAQADRRAQLNPDVASLLASAAHARGLLNNDAVELSHAVSLFERSPRPLLLACALEDLGNLSLPQGQPTTTVDGLDRALALFTEVGARGDAARVRRRLRELGFRRRVVSSDRPAVGWAALTDSELGVARLVAEGLTNREVAERLFVSPHTVNSHLRRVFAKLGVNSRVALTRLAGNLDE
jgi:DNA-binding CsgD family transcriptional regulator/tetratricopeptide (TPR) repeat protein